MVKKTSTNTNKDKFYIEDYTEADKKNVKESNNKKKVRDALRANIQKSINYAQHKEPESKRSRLKKIFSSNGDDETIITLRYGSIVFYQGKVPNVKVFKGKEEDYDAKKQVLERLSQMIDDSKWFNTQYSKYLKVKEGADAKSAKTKASTKKTATKATASKSKKASAKSSAKARSAKAPVSKASAKKASGKTIKKK